MPPPVPPSAEPRSAVPVTIAFYGRPSTRFGRTVKIAMPAEGLRLSDLRERLEATLEGDAADALGAGVRGLVDDEMVSGDPVVRPDQDIAFISAFSGG